MTSRGQNEWVERAAVILERRGRVDLAESLRTHQLFGPFEVSDMILTASDEAVDRCGSERPHWMPIR